MTQCSIKGCNRNGRYLVSRVRYCWPHAARAASEDFHQEEETMKSRRGRRPSNPIDAHVGRRMRIRRVLFGMSQTALANALGITFQQLQKYESGANRISASRLWDIAKVLEVEVGWFYQGLEGKDDLANGRGERDGLELMKSYEQCNEDQRRFLRQTALLFAQASNKPVPMAAE